MVNFTIRTRQSGSTQYDPVQNVRVRRLVLIFAFGGGGGGGVTVKMSRRFYVKYWQLAAMQRLYRKYLRWPVELLQELP